MTIIDSIETLMQSLEDLSSTDLIACDTELTDLDYKKGKLEGIGYGTGKQTYFLPFPHSFPQETVKNFFQQLFDKTVIFHNAKFDLQVLAHNKLPVPKKIHDTMIMSWLVDENTGHGLKQLARDLLGREPKTWEQLDRQINLFRGEEDIMLELAEYCCEDVKNTFDLYFELLPKLKEEELDIAYERVELKFIPVLCSMEMKGIKVDVPFLQERHTIARQILTDLEKETVAQIKAKVPEGFGEINLRSPKQLEKILFDVFNYKVMRQTDKGARATDAETLQEIIKKHKLKDTDFLPMLLRFRELDKLDGTYYVALAEQAGLSNTIHCNFLQHGTRTGRLASSDPNLQNIPSRKDEWNVRQAFIPREGYKFILADYSQLELRMMAHFSKDPTMLETFNNGGDIHAETMKATGTDRHTSKTLNFGIIYGLGPRGLAQQLHIKEDDARKYIYRFFDKYSQMKYFIDKTQALTLKTGYVTMITGRRRHFAEIADKQWWNAIARQSVNTLIQGSASDLVKVAMISMHPLLRNIGASILIQIHDEVLVEVPLDKVEEAKHIIQFEMEHCLKFRVPMVANLVEGDKWVKG